MRSQTTTRTRTATTTTLKRQLPSMALVAAAAAFTMRPTTAFQPQHRPQLSVLRRIPSATTTRTTTPTTTTTRRHVLEEEGPVEEYISDLDFDFSPSDAAGFIGDPSFSFEEPHILHSSSNDDDDNIVYEKESTLDNAAAAPDKTIEDDKEAILNEIIQIEDFLSNAAEATPAASSTSTPPDNDNDDDITQQVIQQALEEESLELEKDRLQDVELVLAHSQHVSSQAEELVESIPLIPMGNQTSEASNVMMEPVGDRPTAPSLQKILQFAIPAIGVWLCSPLLSLIDTSAVGLLSGTAQQAALNPAVAVTDYAALLMAFMYTGATNLVAAAQDTDRGDETKPQASRAMVTAIQLSGYVGAGLGAILLAFARPLVVGMIGNDGLGDEVVTAALKYVRIRALGMPAAAMIGSAQASCLGLQDIRSPLYVLAAAAAVNFLGDVLFVGSKHAWLGGAAGAAWATVISQYAAVAFFTRWLFGGKRPAKTVVNLTKAITEIMGDDNSEGGERRTKLKEAVVQPRESNHRLVRKIQSLTARLRKIRGSGTSASSKKKSSSSSSDASFNTRGFLKGKLNHPLKLFAFPSRKDAQQFVPYVAPVTATQVGRVSGYVAMSHVVSSSLGTSAMAAQQVLVSLFYCLCPIADSLSLTAQSLVPSLAVRAPSKERSMALRKTLRNFLGAGSIFGALMVGAVLQIPLVGRFFTSDPVVIGLVNSVAPYLVGFFSIHGILCAAEGLLLGQTDLSFLGKAYAAFFVAVPYLLLGLKRLPSATLSSVWKIFTAYQFVRLALWVGRTWQLQRRTEVEASATAASAATP